MRVSAAELAALHRRLCATSPLSEAELAALPPPERRELAAGACFLRAGERAREVATVFSGGLREYYVLADGTERSKSFNLPGEFAGSLSDLLSGEPSQTWAVAEVPTVLLVTAWSDYLALVERWPALEQVFKQRHIASYVGITPVHLSRLRSRS